jgi:hypothetical protein
MKILGSHGGEFVDDSFLGVVLCSVVEVSRRFRNRDSTQLSDVGMPQCDYTALHPQTCHLKTFHAFKFSVLFVGR